MKIFLWKLKIIIPAWRPSTPSGTGGGRRRRSVRRPSSSWAFRRLLQHNWAQPRHCLYLCLPSNCAHTTPPLAVFFLRLLLLFQARPLWAQSQDWPEMSGVSNHPLTSIWHLVPGFWRCCVVTASPSPLWASWSRPAWSVSSSGRCSTGSRIKIYSSELSHFFVQSHFQSHQTVHFAVDGRFLRLEVQCTGLSLQSTLTASNDICCWCRYIYITVCLDTDVDISNIYLSIYDYTNGYCFLQQAVSAQEARGHANVQ